MGCCPSNMESKSSKTKSDNKPFKSFVVNNKWKTTRFLGKGGFGRVYEVIDARQPAEKTANSGSKSKNPPKKTATRSAAKYAIKIEYLKSKKPGKKAPPESGRLPQETSVLNDLRNKGVIEHIPQIFDYGPIVNGNKAQYMVMTLLGPSLTQLARILPTQHFSPETMAIISKQMLTVVESLHVSGYLHRDIKPGNFVVGISPRIHTIYLIDYGLSRRYVDENNFQLSPRRKPPLRGTLNYMSSVAMKFSEQSPTDDLWSLFYTWVHLRTGSLPWLRCEHMKDAYKMKRDLNPNTWLKNLEPQYLTIFDCLTSLHFETFPPYEYLYGICDEMMSDLKVTMATPFDWEPEGHYYRKFEPSVLTKMFGG